MRLNNITFISHRIYKEKSISLIKDNNYSDENYTTIILGPNGTGKSTLLREICRMFRDTYGRRNGPYEKKFLEYKYYFNYYLDYDFYDMTYVNQRKKYTVNDTTTTLDKWQFPASIIAVSSLPNDKFIYSKNDDDSIYKYAGIRSSNSSYGTKSIIKNLISLIAKSSFDKVDALKIVLDELGFKKDLNVYFKTKSFDLSNMFNNVNQLDDYFINWKEKSNRKTVPYSYSLYQQINENDKERILDFLTNKIQKDGIYYDLFNEKEFQSFQDDYDVLQILLNLDLLATPLMFFNKNNIYNDDSNISSGEYNLIFQFMRILLLLTDNSLLLIDEPEVSLHPNWQLNYISLLNKCLSKYKGVHTIIATHSHLLLSSLDSKNSAVVTISDNLDFEFIDYDIYGWSPENILYRVFNITSYRNKYFEMDLRKIVKFLESGKGDLDELRSILSGFERFKLTNDDPLNTIIQTAKEKLEI